ncbi:MAG: hypothetical protein A4E48_00083 [Methanosaeta sp. PtaU1.Bin060]|nr:MAG: hypothetical protein A4E48_00083 [Methanosaeta sp. PtaU1.Bin060]
MPLAVRIDSEIAAKMKYPHRVHKLSDVLYLIRDRCPAPQDRRDHLLQPILEHLQSEGPATLAELRMVCHLSGGACVRRLRWLRDAGTVEVVREGHSVYYRLSELNQTGDAPRPACSEGLL